MEVERAGQHPLMCFGTCADELLCPCVQVRDFVRRRRWIRSRVKKPAEAQTGTSISSTASSPIFGQAAPIFASHLGADTQSTRSLNTDSRPNLSKVSTTSSVGTGPIFNRPSGMFATHAGPSGSVSFSGQMSSNSTGQDSPVKAYGVDGSGPSQPDMRGGSSHSLGGVLSGRSSGLEERPYMNLSDVKEGLSSQSRTWGNSVVSELHKAISSAGEGVQPCLQYLSAMQNCSYGVSCTAQLNGMGVYIILAPFSENVFLELVRTCLLWCAIAHVIYMACAP